MKPLTNYQTINDSKGRSAFVVIPYADFVHSQAYVPKDGVPHAVVSTVGWDDIWNPNIQLHNNVPGLEPA